MNKKTIKSDLKRLDATGDDDIDYSDIPELDENFWKHAKPVVSPGKTQLTVRLDSDVLDWFKSQGKGYQSRINAILRSYYEAQQKNSRPSSQLRR